MDDKFLIHVEIADKTYGLWIKRKDEQIIRDAAKHLRVKVNQYRQKFAKSDPDIKELLAMVSLEMAVKRLQLEEKNDTAPFTDKIQQLTKELEVYLEDN